MSEIITTLHKKGDSTVDVYPNIKASNIPNNAITASKINSGAVTNPKLADSSVGESKIIDGSVTSAKIYTGAVTTDKINAGAVTTAKLATGSVDNTKLASNSVATSNIINSAVTSLKINDGAITLDKLDDTLSAVINAVMNRTYLFYIGDSNDTNLVLGGSFIVSDYMQEFSVSDINSAFDFDKAITDYTTNDLEILTEFVNGISDKGFNQSLSGLAKCEIKVNEHTFTIKVNSSTSYEIKYANDQGVTRFDLEWNPQTFTVTNYVNDDYIYININLFANFNALG